MKHIIIQTCANCPEVDIETMMARLFYYCPDLDGKMVDPDDVDQCCPLESYNKPEDF